MKETLPLLPHPPLFSCLLVEGWGKLSRRFWGGMEQHERFTTQSDLTQLRAGKEE